MKPLVPKSKLGYQIPKDFLIVGVPVTVLSTIYSVFTVSTVIAIDHQPSEALFVMSIHLHSFLYLVDICISVSQNHQIHPCVFGNDDGVSYR